MKFQSECSAVVYSKKSPLIFYNFFSQLVHKFPSNLNKKLRVHNNTSKTPGLRQNNYLPEISVRIFVFVLKTGGFAD